MSPNQTLSVMEEAWWMAWHCRRPAPGGVHYGDQSSRHRTSPYQTFLVCRGVAVNMSRKGNCYDTTSGENFFSTLKNELVRYREFQSQALAQIAIVQYIDKFYSPQRLHQALGYRSPEKFEQ